MTHLEKNRAFSGDYSNSFLLCNHVKYDNDNHSVMIETHKQNYIFS